MKDNKKGNMFGYGALIFLGAIGALRVAVIQEYKTQNNPEFDQKLKNTPATLVYKNFSKSDKSGEFFFSTDEQPSTIEAYMQVPVQDEQQKIAFFEAKEGTKKSLMEWKEKFKNKKETSMYPFVKTVFVDR